MDTIATSVNPELSELYIAKVNSLIAAGREALIWSVVAEYDQLGVAESKPVDQAA